jgi:hypothetical protein
MAKRLNREDAKYAKKEERRKKKGKEIGVLR